MQPPDRFYYNLGEFFSDMEDEEDVYFFELGKQIGQFFLGAKSIVESDEIAISLAIEAMDHLGMFGTYDEEEDE